MINMLKDGVRQIKIHNTEIPCYHTHTDSYRYLGVDITPTFNWAPHLDRILTDTKQKAERLIKCALCKAQKMRILRTAIDPSIIYSFAIGCMTELDISKFGAIRTRTCKGINGLPRLDRLQVQWSAKTQTKQDWACHHSWLHTQRLAADTWCRL